MDHNHDRRFDPPHPQSQHRRFVYRSVEPDAGERSHPLRRATDTPHQVQASPSEPSCNALLLQFRVYLKLN